MKARNKDEERDQLLNTPVVQYFELKRPPFPQVLDSSDVLELPHVLDIESMSEFAFQNGMSYAVIGAVGCGKSSALRHACMRLVRLRGHVISVTAGIWSYQELMRHLLAEMGVEYSQYQPSAMTRMIQDKLVGIHADGRKCILMIDEAHLLKPDAFSQLHLLSQNLESKFPLFSLMLCGQEELAEKLACPSARPLASRIAEGYYVPPISREDFRSYMDHHMRLAGAKEMLFDDMGLDALWQVSGANLRSIGKNALAALQYAANNQMRMVDAQCVRNSQRPMWGSFGASSSSAMQNLPDFSSNRMS